MLMLLLVIFCLTFPIYITGRNIMFCVWEPVLQSEGFAQKRIFLETIFIGMGMYILLCGYLFDPAADWYEAVYPNQAHYIIASRYGLSFWLVFGAGALGLCLLGLAPARKLPPLISALAVGLTVILNLLGVFVFIQMFTLIAERGGGLGLYFLIYHFNILLLSVWHIRKHMREQLEIIRERNSENALFRFLSKTVNMSFVCFMMIFIAAALLEIIMILTGQGADGIVKAFTMTADWTFSAQIPPPPLEYSGHYLCTVAAGGHKKVVKPLRYGKRRGAVIVVNRQLCIANAFEELIHDISPRFHKRVRGFYDKHGYPLSKLITTPLRADIVYILMKPLEWVFLVTLYLLDTDPEKRISRQYENK